MSAHRFIVVATTQPDQIPAYLYSHTTVLSTTESPFTDRTVFVVLLTRDVGESDRHAAFLADYQAARFVSGLHAATVYATAAEAYQAVADWTVPSRYATATQEV